MAKPERLPGGFELANGRAADRVSEKEAEAGRSRRGSWSASAAASPWHDPGLRLQRLHKEAFLGAAVSLLVRGRRQAGPREGWPPPRSPGPAASPGSPPPAPTGALVPLPSESGLPAPPTGAGLLLLPLTGGPAASLLTWPLAELCSLLCCPAAVLRPSLYGQKLVPFCPLVGDRPFSPPTETGPAPSCPAVGVAPSASGAPPPGPRPGGYMPAPCRQLCPPGPPLGRPTRLGGFTGPAGLLGKRGSYTGSLHDRASNLL